MTTFRLRMASGSSGSEDGGGATFHRLKRSGTPAVSPTSTSFPVGTVVSAAFVIVVGVA